MHHPFRYKGDVTLSLSVSDIEASIAWYREALGFTLLYHLKEHGWCELAGPEKNITVGLGQSEEVRSAGGCVPVWGVVSIEESRAHLENQNVRFDGPTREVAGMVKLATFYDPDGNAWMLAQSVRDS